MSETTPLTMTLDISTSRIADLLCCGMEGGIGYWAKIETVPGDATPIELDGNWKDVGKYRHIWCALTEGAHIIVWDAEEPEEKLGTLDLEKVKAGLAIMQAKYPRHFNNFLSEDEDAETGDVFIQCAVLGDIVYG